MEYCVCQVEKIESPQNNDSVRGGDAILVDKKERQISRKEIKINYIEGWRKSLA